MGWQAQVNRDDALHESGARGYGGTLTYTQPSHITTSTSGNASVKFRNDGMVVDAGNAAGEDASVMGLLSSTLRDTTHVIEFVLGLKNPTPAGNSMKVGYLQADGLFNSAYLDLVTEEFVYERSNANLRRTNPAHTVGAGGAYLRIVWTGGEAQFTLESRGQTSTATISSGGPINADQLVSAVYDGGGVPLEIPWFRHTIHPQY